MCITCKFKRSGANESKMTKKKPKCLDLYQIYKHPQKSMFIICVDYEAIKRASAITYLRVFFADRWKTRRHCFTPAVHVCVGLIIPRAYRAAEGGERACNSSNGKIQIDSIFRNHVLHCLFHIRGACSSVLVTATVPENIHSLVSQ